MTTKDSVTLSDGRTVTYRKAKVGDILNASRMAGKDEELKKYAIIACRINIDDKPIVTEDLLELDFEDFTKIVEIFPEAQDFLEGGK